VPNDLSFLIGFRKRISLGDNAVGPRSITLINTHAYILNYYSDTISILDINSTNITPSTVSLGEKPVMDKVREGEIYFHDARLCFQGWQSCASCHPDNARMDGLNWDLLNDGIGNPKNTRSLLYSHKTPPAMSLGVRDTAETAVRSGIRHILFGIPNEKIASAIDEYLKSLKPIPSPFLVKGSLSPSAQRGKKIFDEIGCANCHPHGLYTDLKQYDVGTKGIYDKSSSEFDTPTLIEVWRTSPYLHDGSAITLKDVLTVRNKNNAHGETSRLTEQQLKDLIEFILSL
jgi:cytochrome c peroxidase